MRKIYKKSCKICGDSRKHVLDAHHIIPRTDPRSTNLESNLAVICANCHRDVHAGKIILEGIFRTTNGSQLFWHKRGEPYTVRKGIFLNKNGIATIVE